MLPLTHFMRSKPAIVVSRRTDDPRLNIVFTSVGHSLDRKGIQLRNSLLKSGIGLDAAYVARHHAPVHLDGEVGQLGKVLKERRQLLLQDPPRLLNAFKVDVAQKVDIGEADGLGQRRPSLAVPKPCVSNKALENSPRTLGGSPGCRAPAAF